MLRKYIFFHKNSPCIVILEHEKYKVRGYKGRIQVIQINGFSPENHQLFAEAKYHYIDDDCSMYNGFNLEDYNEADLIIDALSTMKSLNILDEDLGTILGEIKSYFN